MFRSNPLFPKKIYSADAVPVKTSRGLAAQKSRNVQADILARGQAHRSPLPLRLRRMLGKRFLRTRDRYGFGSARLATGEIAANRSRDDAKQAWPWGMRPRRGSRAGSRSG